MRHADWVPRLRDAIAAQAATPFAWGVRDCCLAAGDLVAAISDIDPVTPFRATPAGPRYRTARGALGIQLRYLGGTLVGAGFKPAPTAGLLETVAVKRAAELGLAEVPVNFAQRGDIVLAMGETEDGPREVLAVVDLSGRGLITALFSAGWISLPLSAGRRAWRI